jgi:hypothetical protein
MCPFSFWFEFESGFDDWFDWWLSKVVWSGDGLCFLCGSGSKRQDLGVFIGLEIEVLWLMMKTMIVEIIV